MRQKPLSLSEMIQNGGSRQSRLVVYCMLMTKQVVFAIPEPSAATPSPRPPLQSYSPSAGTPSVKAPSSQVPVSSSAPPKRASAPPPGVDLTPELAARRQQIIDRAAVINDEDYFSVLGIARNAPPEAAQQAYLTLAKIWHPDRLAPQLFDVRELAAKVFARMSEARATLSDPAQRAEYALTLRQAPRAAPSGAPGVNAPLEFQKADVFLKKKNFVEALDACRRAHEVDPANADYLALLTWIRIEKDGIGGDAAARHMAALDRAVKLNERCERAYFYRAMLFKRMGKPDKAYVDFKEAAELNPNNIDAAREVLLYRKRAT
jgi:tetratricopeptide (TPR) repeat protein